MKFVRTTNGGYVSADHIDHIKPGANGAPARVSLAGDGECELYIPDIECQRLLNHEDETFIPANPGWAVRWFSTRGDLGTGKVVDGLEVLDAPVIAWRLPLVAPVTVDGVEDVNSRAFALVAPTGVVYRGETMYLSWAEFAADELAEPFVSKEAPVATLAASSVPKEGD